MNALAYQCAYRDATAYQRVAQIKHDCMVMWMERLTSFPTPVRKLSCVMAQESANNAAYWARCNLGELLGVDLNTYNVEGC
jgi:hypothetical protein